jgi:PhnB protein
MKAVNPYLNFRGNTEEAFSFYRSVFGGDFLGIVRYRDFPDNSMGVPEHELDLIAHIALPLGSSNLLMGTDVVEKQSITVGNNTYILLETDSAAEAESLFGGLCAGGHVDMPLSPTEWAEKYGVCRDRFDVQWMISYTGDVQFTHGATS